jgi:tRNA(Arg) A34 adenosine deaminase TadA
MDEVRTVAARWAGLPHGARAALEEQWQGLAARALPCGAAVTDERGRLLASGRNRAYDASTGESPLERTRLAHAELNALALLDTDADWATATLWCTQHPCAMCAAAIAFTGVGRVVYLAGDPSDDSAPDEVAATRRGAAYTELGDPYWGVVSNLLFLSTGAHRLGDRDGNIALARERMPGTAALAVELAAVDALGAAAIAGLSLPVGIHAFDGAILSLLSEAG